MTASLPGPLTHGRTTPLIAPVVPAHEHGDIRPFTRVMTAAVLLGIGLGLVAFVPQPESGMMSPFEPPARPAAVATRVQPASDAYGMSGQLRVRVAMPGDEVEFPLEVAGDPTQLSYRWYRIADSTASEEPRPLGGASLRVPSRPGFYHLAIGNGSTEVILKDITLGVLVPFQRKLGATLNGYTIGWYRGERFGRAREAPEGFLEVFPRDLDLALSARFRVSDFITQDDQRVWPRYVAVNPQLLDKLELVASRVARNQGFSDDQPLRLDVKSGFRTPAHNRDVRWAARDSRHQFGDAADVAIDVNGDGRFTSWDSRAVALAVEMVEREYPNLAGGLGVYTGRRWATPYVHIDTRGHRARWRG